MMLSEEFVAGRVFEGDARRAEQERELVRRGREQRAERRAERLVERAARSLKRHTEGEVARADAAREVAPAAEAVGEPAVEPHAESVSEPVAESRRELAHAGR